MTAKIISEVQLAAARFDRFQSRKDVAEVCRKYSHINGTFRGLCINRQMGILAFLLLDGSIDHHQYVAGLRRMSKATKIKQKDIQILAQLQLETTRLALAGTDWLFAGLR